MAAKPAAGVTPELSKRRTTLRFIRTLLWKNWLLKRRHVVASVLEVALPCLFVVLLSGLKHLVADVDVPAGWSDDQTSTSDDTLGTSYNLYQPTGGSLPWIPGDLPKFTQYETSLTGLLLYLSLLSAQNGRDLNELSANDKETCLMGVAAYGMVDTNTSSAYAVPSECDGRVAPYKLAIVPDTAFTRAYFLETLALWYPRVNLLNTTTSLQIPSLAESVTFFDSEEQLETYVKGNDYGSTIENPRIYGGIVFDTFPDEGSIGSFQSIEYTLRLNSTTGSGGVMGRIPSTNGDPAQLSPLEHAIETDYYTRYALTGFMTLQTLVTRFVTCMPEWDAVSKTTTGKCQLEQSTAASSSDLDDRLLSTLDNDVMIAATLSTLATYGGGSAMNVSFAELITQLDNSTKETLLAPLRQAPQPYLGSSVAPFPVEAYIDSGFYDDVSDVIAIIFIMSYLYPLSRVLVVLIQEKELRLREFMKILGMRESAITASWYMTYTAVFFLGSLLQALTGLLGIFANSSVVLIFLFFFLFGLSVLSYCFMVSTVFSDARLGAFVGMIAFFLMHFVASAFSTETPESKKTWGCLLSPVALSLGIDTLSSAESTGTGITFSNVDVVNENFRFSTSLWMFAFDSAIYTLLGLYLDKVVPKQYGTTLPWNFPISPKYWINRRQNRQILKADEALLDDVVLDVNPNFEPVNSELREQERHGEVLSVQRLRKVFDVPGGEKVAVKGLNLTMYKNQITCLLGHNGAGKTTLISMLTGMTAPTGGNAVYNGKSINDDMAEIRESLGICFQHDVLFAELTVEEHLLFFGRIKGYTDEELRVVADTQIREVGLTEKRHVQSNELSGGMKRKLSVAVSLLGDSSLVFLDEPTSGMDPYSRRSTWEILLNNRNDRVMVLTTHFMDEADILGDRIAIMSEGEVRCCGSSLFLKNRFGAGYNLTLVKDDERCKENDVVSFVTSFVPSAQLLSNVGSEIAFQLPLSCSPQFAELFGSIDDRLIDLGLLSYGVSVTTLEEVFIKVAEQDDEDNQHTLSKEAASITPVPSPTNTNDGEVVDGSLRTVFFTQLRALILKRFRYARRDRKSVIFSTVYPITLLLIGLVLLKNSGRTKDDPALALNTDAYDGDESPAPFYCQGGIGSWCISLAQSSYYSGASLQELSIDPPAFESDSPTVFGVQYSAQTVNASDATGYGLRLGEVVYDRGYGIGSTAVQDQYGAYLVYGDSDRNVLGYNVFVNSTAAHSPIIFKALMDQAVYRFLASNLSDSSATSVELKVNNHPLPLTASAKTLFGNQMAFSACVFIGIAFTYFTASIVVFLVKERQAEHNSKHQQLVSGVSLAAFWLSNYVYDLLVYVIPFASALILIKAFDISTMTGSSECYSCTSETFPAVIVLFVLFGFAVCPFTYCLSYLFKEHASSQTYTIMINLVIGVVLMVVSYILDQIDSTKSVNSVLVFFWRLSPLFDLGNGLLNLVLNEANSIKSSSTTKTSPFSTDIMGYEMIYLVVLTIVYGALAVGIDYAMTFPSVKSIVAGDDGGDLDQVDLDVDVENEAARVARGDADNDVVKLANLRKVYPGGKVAVRDLSFGLKRGECFGFLGINGAGKTTTMKMLTGDELPTHGKAALGGYDILTQQMEVRRQIGYCPQFDALFDKLTVREHLELFAAIKGIRHNELEAVVMEKIHQMNLTDFENKLAGSLSGGNKRKLSVAIAMIGNPRIIFLDEPSTGMDPVSRRFMWDVIAGISTRGKSSTIVLTTHSMEEAEALCSRVGIMVGGRLRCLGSTQHLKSRFGDGFVFDVKLSPPTPEELERSIQENFGESGGIVTQADLEAKCHAFGNHHLAERVVASHPTGYSLAAAIERDGFIRAAAFSSWCIEETRFEALRSFLETTFGLQSVVVMERQNDFCRFKLRAQDGDLKLSKLFALIEEAKTSLFIREYSVSQTTLEQIFNGFASQQQEEQGVARGVVGS